jgi:hypothetical protein
VHPHGEVLPLDMRRADVADVRPMPPGYVKPYVKRNKHDAADAEARQPCRISPAGDSAGGAFFLSGHGLRQINLVRRWFVQQLASVAIERCREPVNQVAGIEFYALGHALPEHWNKTRTTR